MIVNHPLVTPRELRLFGNASLSVRLYGIFFASFWLKLRNIWRCPNHKQTTWVTFRVQRYISTPQKHKGENGAERICQHSKWHGGAGEKHGWRNADAELNVRRQTTWAGCSCLEYLACFTYSAFTQKARDTAVVFSHCSVQCFLSSSLMFFLRGRCVCVHARWVALSDQLVYIVQNFAQRGYKVTFFVLSDSLCVSNLGKLKPQICCPKREQTAEPRDLTEYLYFYTKLLCQ